MTIRSFREIERMCRKYRDDLVREAISDCHMAGMSLRDAAAAMNTNPVNVRRAAERVGAPKPVDSRFRIKRALSEKEREEYEALMRGRQVSRWEALRMVGRDDLVQP